MYKALVIGCGNIGALYDFNNDQILTHAKAYYKNKYFELSIYDSNRQLAKEISDKYHCKVIDEVDQKKMKSFDCVSICTPTPTHFKYILEALQAGIKVVICEKPISYSGMELADLKTVYDKSCSKIIVNYIRRFQPAFHELKQTIMNLSKNDSITNICIRYHRGFINNCSHAFDTVEYLTDSQIILRDIKISNCVFDYFENDPTLSLQANWNNVNVSIIGLTNISFSLFEIDIFFHYNKVCIKNAGQIIEIYRAAEKGNFPPLGIKTDFSRDHCLKDYNKHVINHVHHLLNGDGSNDNFLASIDLNLRMLTYMNN